MMYAVIFCDIMKYHQTVTMKDHYCRDWSLWLVKSKAHYTAWQNSVIHSVRQAIWYCWPRENWFWETKSVSLGFFVANTNVLELTHILRYYGDVKHRFYTYTVFCVYGSCANCAQRISFNLCTIHCVFCLLCALFHVCIVHAGFCSLCILFTVHNVQCW